MPERPPRIRPPPDPDDSGRRLSGAGRFRRCAAARRRPHGRSGARGPRSSRCWRWWSGSASSRRPSRSPPPPRRPAPPTGSRSLPADASSSSAFCASATGDAAATTIYLTNSTARAGRRGHDQCRADASPRSGSDRPTGGGGSSAGHGRGRSRPTGLPQGSTASSFAFAGGGVVASQVVSGPLGWSTAPCASQTSSPVGLLRRIDHRRGTRLQLALFNPAAPAATVNISFLTPSGLVTPQAYQGLVVPPGRLIVENVGGFVQRAAAVATFITSQAGGLVSTEFQQTSSAEPAPGSPSGWGPPSCRRCGGWPRPPTARARRSAFDLANPDPQPVTATISFGSGVGLGDAPAAVDPAALDGGVRRFDGRPAFPTRCPTRSRSIPRCPSSSGVRSWPAGSRPPQWGSSSATVTAATRWLVPRPGSAGAGNRPCRSRKPGRGQSGAVAARVEVVRLGGGRTVATLRRGPRPAGRPRAQAGRRPLHLLGLVVAARERRGGQPAVRRVRRGLVDRVPRCGVGRPVGRPGR